jgi:hypothetical protein
MMMHRVGYSLLLVFSFAFLLVLGRTARCQEKSSSPAVEYKAVAFGTDEKENTRKLNELAADGWDTSDRSPTPWSPSSATVS